jgi:hypothetical protein
VEEPESQVDVPRGIKIVEEDTNHDEAKLVSLRRNIAPTASGSM